MTHTLRTLTDTVQILNPTLSLTEARTHIDTVLQAIKLLTNEDESTLKLRHFGTFTRTLSQAKTGHNPITLAEVHIPATSCLRFKPSRSLRIVRGSQHD